MESSVYYQLGDFTGLVEASRRGIVSDPSEWLEHYFLGVGYQGLGKRTEAIPEFEKAVSMSGGDQDASAALAHGYALVGRREQAEVILRDLTRRSKEGYVSPYLLGVVHAGLGDRDTAFAFLEQAIGERSLDVVWNMKVDPRLATLRSDPRFQSLWAGAGFPR